MSENAAKKRRSFKEIWSRILHGAPSSLSFEQVLSAELSEVESSRSLRLKNAAGPAGNGSDEAVPGKDNAFQKAVDMKLAGLAFSGGGIRSATFNLGILQGLARIGLLRRFDYLSTVSGGGYIGGWLSAWTRREQSLAKVEERLHCQRESCRDFREPDPIAFLRKYSNYLTPKMGMLSADTWALVAVYLRNLVLNLLIITSLFLAFFLMPHIAARYASLLASGNADVLFNRTLRFLAGGVFFIAVNQTYWFIKKEHKSAAIDYPWYTRQWAILLFVVLPIMMSALCGGLWLWSFSAHNDKLGNWDTWDSYALSFILYVLGTWLAGSLTARTHVNVKFARKESPHSVWASTVRMMGRQARESIEPTSRRKIVAFLICLFFSILAGFGLFSLLARLFHAWHDTQSWLWLATNFSGPLVMLVYGMIGTLLIGFMGLQMEDESREWWSRLKGWLIICTALWTSLCSLAFFSLPVIAKATTLISLGWIISTIGGVFLGKSPLTGGKGSKKWIETLAAVLPSIFVAGLLMFLAFMTSSVFILRHEGWSTFWTLLFRERHSFDELLSANYLVLEDALAQPLIPMFFLSLMTALALSWRIDINQFSIHLLYRNRLIRGYLGASNENREFQPFAGFDPNDDLSICTLQTTCDQSGETYVGPYPIINTALNLVKGKQLAWQTRKAASFTFSPLYSGYESRSSHKPYETLCCYQQTENYGKPDGMSLGTAMAISGAAASPNMGYHSSPALTFLMTVFNVRLGWWSGNPRYTKQWQKAGPLIGLWYMLIELFGLSDDESGFVYLSDGGHFENLGLYELVKRRCRFIIVCDAGQDQGMKFDDLGNALRKIQVDLGVDVVIDVSPIRKHEKRCALGKIIYHTASGQKEHGDLIYIKASLCGNEPIDVQNYKARHKEFPHQTTADQWFDEDQFESYRMLGLHTIQEIFKPSQGGDFEGLVTNVEQYLEAEG